MEHLSFGRGPLFTFNSSVHRRLSPNVFRAIQSSLDVGHFDRPLLQNLTGFTFDQNFGGISLRDACIFLGLRLKMLNLTIPRSRDGLRTFATALKARCPNIERLYISYGQHSDQVNRVVSDLICSLSSLRAVHCMNITCNSRAIKHLSSRPSLQDLHVLLPDELVQQNILDGSSNIRPFLAIQDLDITVASIASAVEFLKVTSSSSNLESLSIIINHILPTPAQLHVALAVMQQNSFCNTLTTFVLGDNILPTGIPLHAIDGQTLAPLLQCRNLEHINIHISYGHAAIDNSLLKDMASAWPRLRSLGLYASDAHLWHAKADLRGLVCLAQNCHSLESVSLQFDVSLPPTAIYPDEAIRCEWLTQLEVACSRVSNPLAIATFLADVFPNLTLCHDHYLLSAEHSEDERPEYIEMAKRWDDIIQILDARRQSLTDHNVCVQSLIYK